jgi:hypothetical protein
MGRSNQGLHRPALDAWVEAAKAQDDPNKKLTGLLLPFTGLRVDEFRHIHGPTWLSWIDSETGETSDGGPPKLSVPDTGTCHLDGNENPCTSCAEDGEFTTKYDDGREIPLIETWKNWNRGDHETYVEEELDLRGLCKSYFKVTPSDYGNEMVDGDGVSHTTVNRWCKQIAIDAEIGYERGLVSNSQFNQKVPDVIPHDMRGTFIMQLIRNNMQRTKLIKYTGHDHVSSLQPYEERVSDETDAREFLDRI